MKKSEHLFDELNPASGQQDSSLWPFRSFNVLKARLRLRFWTAIREKCLDKFVDTLLEEPANQRDDTEDAENEYHQISCWRSHCRKCDGGTYVEEDNESRGKARWNLKIH